MSSPSSNPTSIPSASSPHAEPHVALRDVRVAFGPRVVFDGLDCAFPRGSISMLMGGSGSGKSTLLRLVGGLLRPSAGSIRVAGEEITGLSESRMTRVRRRLGMLFQFGALLDSLTVRENVELPLREQRRLSAAEIAREVDERLEEVGLGDAGDLLPRQLSGGMIRRAGLARAIVTRPEIVLCDEPFSGLDPVTTRRIEALLVDLNQHLGLTLIVASHHIASARRMAQQILLIQNGRVVVGPPDTLEHGDDPEVREFFEADRDGPFEAASQRARDAR
jgi:phospholipid/cholesterol/gamma-HCH transport system ATP-binding protein